MATPTRQLLKTGHGTIEVTLTPGVKVMECKYMCGDVFVVSTRTRHAPHHLECAIAASVECTKQLREHQGPYYDKWLRAMAMWVARMRLSE